MAGPIQVDFPKVRGTKSPFRSQLLAAWERTSPAVLSLLPGLYVEGLSTRAVERVLEPVMEGAGLSRSSVSRANEEIKAGFDLWRKRSLAGEEVIYLFLDGYYQGVRFGTREKEAILVAHGIRADGSRVLLGVYLGGRESTESWRQVLHDLVDRGLRQPLLLISDGNPGLIRAVKDIWPMVPRRRCVQHRLRNILARVPVKSQEAVRRALNRIFYADSLEEAVRATGEFVGKYGREYASAAEVLLTDLEDWLTFFRFPRKQWKRLRTSNGLERELLEVRRRTRVVGRFPDEGTALSLVWAVMEERQARWRGIAMGVEQLRQVREAAQELEANPITVGLDGTPVA